MRSSVAARTRPSAITQVISIRIRDLVVTTSGALGGWMQPGGPFTAAPLAGPREDAYGCGDSFVAGLTYALGIGLEDHDAVAFAARCGAGALTGRGVAPQPVALVAAAERAALAGGCRSWRRPW